MTTFKEYDEYDALGLAELVAAKDVSAEELLEEAIERTERINPTINAVVQKHYDEARAVIDAGLPNGPFEGVPFLLKPHCSIRRANLQSRCHSPGAKMVCLSE